MNREPKQYSADTSVLFLTNIVAFLLNFDLNLGNDLEYNLDYDMLAHNFLLNALQISLNGSNQLTPVKNHAKVKTMMATKQLVRHKQDHHYTSPLADHHKIGHLTWHKPHTLHLFISIVR